MNGIDIYDHSMIHDTIIIRMKNQFIIIFLTMICLSCTEKKEEEAKMVVEKAVEAFRQTMLHPDQATFEALTSTKLSYGHSSGLIEDQATCITSMVSGKFKFLRIDIINQTVDVEGNTAIVRHEFKADTHDEGKDPGTVKLNVLQVWHKLDDHWRLLARQAVKVKI